MQAVARIVLIGASLAGLAASAQEQPARIRGTVQSLQGQSLTIATAAGGPVSLALTETTGINGVEAKTVADIGPNTFIGATAVKDPAGRWQATEIHIFPESMRGAGEGHYAWDLPESTMTNGAVTGSTVSGAGSTLRVEYAGGQVDVDVTPRTAIVALTAGDRSLLVPGATVFALAVPSPSGGAATAVAVVAETKGVKPPM